MVEVNFVTVLVAAVASMAVGFFWYSPFWLGKPWMKLMGITSKSMKDNQVKMGKMYLLSFGAAILTAFVLYHLTAQAQAFFGMEPLVTGLLTAFWGWLGLVMPVQLTDVIFGGKKWMLFGINTGYQLAALLSMGLVIGLFV